MITHAFIMPISDEAFFMLHKLYRAGIMQQNDESLLSLLLLNLFIILTMNRHYLAKTMSRVTLLQ